MSYPDGTSTTCQSCGRTWASMSAAERGDSVWRCWPCRHHPQQSPASLCNRWDCPTHGAAAKATGAPVKFA